MGSWEAKVKAATGGRCGGRYQCAIILSGCHRCVFVPSAFCVLPFRTRVYPCMRACVCMSACIFMCGRVPPLTFEVGVAADQVTCVGQDRYPTPCPHPSRPAQLHPGHPSVPLDPPPRPMLPSPLSPYPRQPPPSQPRSKPFLPPSLSLVTPAPPG